MTENTRYSTLRIPYSKLVECHGVILSNSPDSDDDVTWAIVIDNFPEPQPHRGQLQELAKKFDDLATTPGNDPILCSRIHFAEWRDAILSQAPPQVADVYGKFESALKDLAAARAEIVEQGKRADAEIERLRDIARKAEEQAGEKCAEVGRLKAELQKSRDALPADWKYCCFRPAKRRP